MSVVPKTVSRWLQVPATARAPTLLLRPRARLAAMGPDAIWDWADFSGDADAARGSGTLGDVASLHLRQPAPAVALVIPGEDVLMLDVHLPPVSEGQGESAVPYLVEDYLLEDLERVHIALAKPRGDGLRRAVAINAQCLAQTLALLEAARLPVAAAWVDHELLAAGRGGPCAFIDGDRLLLCAPDAPGFAGTRGVAARWLALHGPEMALGTGDVAGTAFFTALHWPLAGRNAVDVLQGAFEPPARRSARRNRLLRRVGAVSVLPVLLAVFALALGLWHAQRVQVIRAETRAVLVREHPAFADAPSLERAIAVHARWASRTTTANTPGFGVLAGACATQLGRMRPEERPRLVGLRYLHARGYLELLLDAGSVQALDALQAGLAARGIGARLVSASRAGERFEGRLRVGHETR